MARMNVRQIGLWTSTSIVAGCMIGTGVFIKPATMAAQLGSVQFVLLAWFVSGLLSFAGALTYAELCARVPAAGGEYAILRESYGGFTAYLYGWMRFTIGAPGSAASYAVGAAVFLHVVVPYQNLGIHTAHMAVFFIALFTLLNCLTLWVSASVQLTLTAVKILSVAAIVAVLFFLTPASAATPPPAAWPGMVPFSAALMGALWAYDGWNNLPMLGGEVKDARRNLPLALAIGMAIVLVVYVLLNTAFFRVLDFSEVLQANPSAVKGAQSVATYALAKSIPATSVKIVSALLVISALGAMNGSILASARVPYAMAVDGLFFRSLGHLSKRHALPVAATFVQGLIAVVLALSGTFDQLTDSVVFASWIFYALTASALFRLRKWGVGEALARYRTPLYPLLPLAFIVCALALIGYAVLSAPYLTALGAAVIGAGVPLYYYFSRAS